MANYAVTDWSSDPQGTYKLALAELETKLETIDSAKTIRFIDIQKSGTEFYALLVYDA